MKSVLSFAIIIAVISISIFGWMAMDFAHGHARCIAAIAGVSECAAVQDPFAILSFHFNVLRSFSHGTVAVAPFVAVLSLLAFVTLLLLLKIDFIVITVRTLLHLFYSIAAFIATNIQARLRAYLVLYEHRAPVLA